MSKHEIGTNDVVCGSEDALNLMETVQECAAISPEGKGFCPTERYIIFMPYIGNPYRAVKTASGLVIPDSATSLNRDTGEQDRKWPEVRVGKVISVGPEVSFIRPGDDIFYEANMARPVPFMNYGLFRTHETQVSLVVANQESLLSRVNESLEYENRID